MQEVKLMKIEKKLKNHPKIENLRVFLTKFFHDYSAECIILFGSSVKGSYNKKSDLDLLIITNSLDQDYFKRAYQMQDITPGGIDFFVYSTEEFDKMVSELHLIVLEALSSGIIIHDKGFSERYINHISKLIKDKKLIKLEQGWKLNS